MYSTKALGWRTNGKNGYEISKPETRAQHRVSLLSNPYLYLTDGAKGKLSAHTGQRFDRDLGQK